MNGLLANVQLESALLTSFLMIGKYFYINLWVSITPDSQTRNALQVS
jgi:hypothetical protein